MDNPLAPRSASKRNSAINPTPWEDEPSPRPLQISTTATARRSSMRIAPINTRSPSVRFSTCTPEKFEEISQPRMGYSWSMESPLGRVGSDNNKYHLSDNHLARAISLQMETDRIPPIVRSSIIRSPSVRFSTAQRSTTVRNSVRFRTPSPKLSTSKAPLEATKEKTRKKFKAEVKVFFSRVASWGNAKPRFRPK
jgi:hypothetical protein